MERGIRTLKLVLPPFGSDQIGFVLAKVVGKFSGDAAGGEERAVQVEGYRQLGLCLGSHGGARGSSSVGT